VTVEDKDRLMSLLKEVYDRAMVVSDFDAALRACQLMMEVLA
jgi:hypothetical protein